MTDSERKTLIEKCAKAMGYEFHVWDSDGIPSVLVGDEWEEWNPLEDLADCAAMNAESMAWTAYYSKYVTVSIKGFEGLANYSDHNGDKKAAWMMASARCVAATQE